mmetsp:Transcript_48384/g.89723  ORF Transcript_48384/g.89723 Transcript_48384/m.89723 type:complete len:191 (-) Transcript_48384:199-771(-)|eukprot:CAMPEP_0197436366 /NCGR_PEP_ID=MMETSP1175-20131217/3831_1 /TAXON_ID=1003142 /ORGANISM="Triceratium dubium, Strain CCMP147" /LENGTH=190 /DNA_ID=CAMNT_0042965637 /DNA_START=608 /DNA_END=1180 /DNA_ORIENTATION=+
MTAKHRLYIVLVALAKLSFSGAFVPIHVCQTQRFMARATQDDEGEREIEDEPPVIAESVVRIDDGGSDLTDRFKYKVNALMGNFDPPAGAVDDEHQNGNILSAMLIFPAEYSFSVVGRTGGDDELKEEYAESVRRIVASVSGDDDGLAMRVTPRGKSFTRVSVQVTVDSAAVITSIYEELGSLERTVMRY